MKLVKPKGEKSKDSTIKMVLCTFEIDFGVHYSNNQETSQFMANDFVFMSFSEKSDRECAFMKKNNGTESRKCERKAVDNRQN